MIIEKYDFFLDRSHIYLSIGLISKIRDCGIDMVEELVCMNVHNLTKSALL